MRAKTKKWFSPLFVLTLAVAGIFGVTAKVVDKQAEEAPVVEKADAGTSTTLYYAANTSNPVRVNICVRYDGDWEGGSTWYQVDMSKNGKTKGGLAIYECTFTDMYDGARTLQFQQMSNGNPTITRTAFENSWTAVGNYNGKMWIEGQSGLKEYSYDSDNTYTFYLDKTNWKTNTTPKLYWWSVAKNATVSGSKVTSRVDGTTYSNHTIWYTFSVTSSVLPTGLIFFEGTSIDSNTKKTGDITSNIANNKIFGIDTDGGTSSTASAWGSDCDGKIYKFTRYRRMGSAASPVAYGDPSYVLKGESYNPGKPSAAVESGYVIDGDDYWYKNSSYTGTGYNDDNYCPASGGSDINLYAKFKEGTYTITFDPNGGTGSITTRNKTHNTPFTIPSLANLGIGAGVGRTATGWNTESHGSGVAYDLGGTYTDNAATTLYLMEDYNSYEYSVDGGSSWVQMPKMSTTPELCIAGYESDTSNYLPAGAIITFRSYYGTGEHTTQTINIWAGNQYADEGGNHHIEFGTHNKVVLTVQNDGNFKVNIFGGSERGIAITRNHYDTKYVSDLIGNDYYATVEVLPGDQIKAFHSWRTVYDVTMTNYASYGIDVNGNVSVPAVYYFKLVYVDGNYPNVNVENMVAVDTAKLIAQTFIADMTPLCEGMEGGAAPSTLTTQWATEFGYYTKLSNDTKNILKGTTASSDTDVLAMRAKYDRIVAKYKNSGAGINDYMTRNPSLAINNFKPFELISGEDGVDASVIIIIVASSISILSITALSVLMVKKKKSANK